MSRTIAPEPPRTVVHHAGPRVVVYVAMALLAAMMLPAFILAPARTFGGGGVIGVLAFIAFEVVLLAIARRRVVLTVDAAMTTLTMRGIRWPLPERSWEVALADVRAVTVQRSPRGPAYRLVLVLRSGAEMPLTNSHFGDTGHMARDAAAVRRLCRLEGGG